MILVYIENPIKMKITNNKQTKQKHHKNNLFTNEEPF